MDLFRKTTFQEAGDKKDSIFTSTYTKLSVQNELRLLVVMHD
jgi:hypothetical protein